MEETPIATTAAATPAAAPPAAKKPKAKVAKVKATKVAATAAPAKPKAAKKPATGSPNLSLADARAKFMRELLKGRKNRTDLKKLVNYGNYTALCHGLIDDGMIKAEKTDEDPMVFYVLTAKGRANAQKKLTR